MAAAAMLDAAREELRVAAARGIGGLLTLGRYTERVDVLLRQLFDTVAPAAQPVSVIALGGYGAPGTVPAFRHRSAAALREAPRHRRRSFRRPLPQSALDLGVVVGHQVRDLEELSRLEADNPEFLLALLDARPLAGDRWLFNRFMAAFHRPDVHAQILAMLLTLIERSPPEIQRHALSAGARHQRGPGRAAGRHRRADDRGVDRSDAGRPQPGRSAAARRSDRLPVADRPAAAPRNEAEQQRADARAPGKDRRIPGLPGDRAASARRADDERLFPSRPRGQPLVAVGTQGVAEAGRAEPRAMDERRRVHRLRPGQAASRALVARVSGRHRRAVRRHRLRADGDERAGAAARARGFLPHPGCARRAAAIPDAAARAVRPPVRDARCRAARPDVPGIPGDLLARRPRLLPSTPWTSTRS